jgi:CheY-like chemotaxis protein/HPt (histidine-containing phosphotransfer) domain-containing protein
VRSRLGDGTVFDVELPYGISTEQPPPQATGDPSSVVPADLSNTRVLLVEDNKVNQFLARQLLTKMGLKVTAAGNAEAAIAELKNATFDIILMDVQLPGMSGYELSRCIRRELPSPQRDIPIIAITAYVSANEKEAALEAGMEDYLSKPYNPQELLSVILKHLPKQKGAGPSLEQDLLQLMGGSQADLAELIEVFVEQTPAMNEELIRFIRARNWKKAWHTAHKLKSSLRILKSGPLNALINRIEENTEGQKHLGTLEGLFLEYEALCSEYIRQLQAFLPGSGK